MTGSKLPPGLEGLTVDLKAMRKLLEHADGLTVVFPDGFPDEANRRLVESLGVKAVDASGRTLYAPD